MNEWISFCSSRGITLLEDCAQAHLANWYGKVAGSFGVAGAYSFYPTKNLGAIGDAGMLVTSDDDLVKRACRLRNYGQSIRYHHAEIGMNSRLDEIQAAMLATRLSWLPNFTERRRQIADTYRSRIANTLITQLARPEESLAHTYHLYVICCEQRDALQAYLQCNQIQSFIHYPIPVHKQGPCLSIKRDPIGLGNSERHAATCLSLPCHPQMTDDHVNTVVAVINSFQGF